MEPGEMRFASRPRASTTFASSGTCIPRRCARCIAARSPRWCPHWSTKRSDSSRSSRWRRGLQSSLATSALSPSWCGKAAAASPTPMTWSSERRWTPCAWMPTSAASWPSGATRPTSSAGPRSRTCAATSASSRRREPPGAPVRAGGDLALILFYHELSEDRSPLSVSPELFSAHLEVISACGANVLTAGELADALPAAAVQEPAVVITFDDGFAQAVGEARGRLKEAGMHATFFCVAGHLGATSEWPGRRPDTPVRPLASVEELAALARDGHEIGSHGWSHAALDGETDLRR